MSTTQNQTGEDSGSHGHHHHHKRRAPYPRGPQGEPNAAFLVDDTDFFFFSKKAVSGSTTNTTDSSSSTSPTQPKEKPVGTPPPEDQQQKKKEQLKALQTAAFEVLKSRLKVLAETTGADGVSELTGQSGRSGIGYYASEEPVTSPLEGSMAAADATMTRGDVGGGGAGEETETTADDGATTTASSSTVASPLVGNDINNNKASPTATTATAATQRRSFNSEADPSSTSSAAAAAATASSGAQTPKSDDELPPLAYEYLSSKRVDMSVLCPKLRQKNLRRLFLKTLRGAVTAFVYAGIGRLIIGIVKALLRCGLSRTRFLKFAQREIFNANHFKWGTVAAGLSCYRLLQQLVLRISPNMSVPISCAIGGGLASLPMMVLNVETREELGLYLGVRAIHGALCANWNSLPWPLESWRNYKDWTVIYMMALCVEILYTFTYYPETHTPSYVQFLARNTRQNPDNMHCLAALSRRSYTPYYMKMYRLNNMNIVTPEFAKMAAEGVGGCEMKPGARIMDVNDFREACLFSHGDTPSCSYAFFRTCLRHFLTISVPLYFPLKITTTLAFGLKRALKKPLETVKKMFISSMRSSAFLTLYACLPIGTICISANSQFHSPLGAALIAGIGGIATFLEPPARRIDLALYCSLHGLRSFINLLHVKWGIIPRPTSEWVFYLQTAAVAALFYQYDENYSYIHSNVRGACGWLFKEKRCSDAEVEYATRWQGAQDAMRAAIAAEHPQLLLEAIAEAEERVRAGGEAPAATATLPDKNKNSICATASSALSSDVPAEEIVKE